MREDGYLDTDDNGVRAVVLFGTLGLHAVLAVAVLLSWNVADPGNEQNRLSVFDLAPQSAKLKPEPAHATLPEAQQAEETNIQPAPERPQVELPQLSLLRDNPFHEMPSTPSPEPQIEPTEPPQETPAPPAAPQQRTREGEVTWKDRVLAALNEEKSYPSSAQRKRQQGVPWIRFVIDRNGNVLSSNLERSSGFDVLDREAIRLPRKAQPLPSPPGSIPGQRIELVVPVEFFMR